MLPSKLPGLPTAALRCSHSTHCSVPSLETLRRDGFLRMWDLVKGRCTYTVRLEAEAEAVHFCQEDGGARYALLCGTLLTLHSVGEAGTLRALAHPRRALCMAWAHGGRIVSGSEDGSLRLWDSQVCGCCCALKMLFCLLALAAAALLGGRGPHPGCWPAALPLPCCHPCCCLLRCRRCRALPPHVRACQLRQPLHAAIPRCTAPVKETPFTHSTLGLTVQC